MTQEKAVNYTPEMEKIILAAVPFDYERAKSLGVELDRKAKSIIAKCKRLEASEVHNPEGKEFYKAKPEYVSKTGKDVEKKADIVTSLETILGIALGTLKGLDKAQKKPLEDLRKAIIALNGNAILEVIDDLIDNIGETNDDTKAVENVETEK